MKHLGGGMCPNRLSCLKGSDYREAISLEPVHMSYWFWTFSIVTTGWRRLWRMDI